MKRYLVLACVVLFAGCQTTTKKSQPNIDQVIKQESKHINTPKKPVLKNYSWTGYYSGNVVTKNKKIVKTILKLVAKEGKMGYLLYENDGRVKEDRGMLTLLKNGSVIRLKNGRLVFIGQDFVAFISDVNKSPDKDKILEKLEFFIDDERRLLVDKSTVVEGSVDGHEAIQFDGILNVRNKNYRSLKATYVLNCVKKTYAISETRYYKDKFATGGLVDMVKNSEGAFFGFDNTKDVMYQSFRKYCEKK